MRCELCRYLVRTSYEYGEYECSLGIPESDCFEDDEDYIQRMIDEHYYIEVIHYTMYLLKENHAELYPVCVDYAKHAIGLDYVNPYTRHGKQYYRAYRNYYDSGECDIPAWETLCDMGFAEHGEGRLRHWYTVTRYGLDWLEIELGIKIYG